MAKRELEEALDDLLVDLTQTARYEQSNLNKTSTLITKANVEALLTDWYKGLAKGDLNKVNAVASGKVAKPTAVSITNRLNTTAMQQGLVDGTEAYMKAIKEAVLKINLPDTVYIGIDNIPTELSWTFLGEGKASITAGSLNNRITRPAMTALSKWVDANWEQIELNALDELGGKGNRNKLFKSGVSDSGGARRQLAVGVAGTTKLKTSGSLSSYGVFGHGIPGGAQNGENYSSTAYAVGILQQLIGQGNKAVLNPNNANPILKEFQKDLLDLFTVNAHIDVYEAPGDLFDKQKQFIHIKGELTTKKGNQAMAPWDRGRGTRSVSQAGELDNIKDKLANSIKGTFDRLVLDIKQGKEYLGGRNLGDLGTSPSAKEKIGRKAVVRTLKELKTAMPEGKITSKTKRAKKRKRKPVKRSKPLSKTNKPAKITTRPAKKPTGKRNTGRRTTKTNTGATRNPLALKALLQKALPDEVASKMTGGNTLHYRTGRFSDSAEIINVVPYPNSLEVQYTYQKDPYQVFEPGSGSPLATRGRDPRQLIGSTIRELAQSLMGDRFMVRTKRI